MKYSKYARQVKYWFSNHWHGLIAGIIITGIASLTLGLQITHFADSQTAQEMATMQTIASFPDPSERMINAPYLLPSYAIGKVIDSPITGARTVSAVYALLATAALFFVLKRWYSTQIASISSLLFATSSWVLALSHQATPLIMLVFTPLLLLASLSVFVFTRKHVTAAFITLCLSLVFALYIPYMLWLIGIISIALLTLYKQQLRSLNNKTIAATAVISGILLLPLLVSLVQYPGQVKELFGIPTVWPTILVYASQLIGQISTMVFIAQPFPELYVGKLALLDIFSVAMMLLGLYAIARFAPKKRRLLFGLALAIFLLIVPLQTPYQLAMALFLPFIYIAIGSGINELIKQWFSYFPRNPFARNTAVILVALLIGLSTLYNLQRFYVAWAGSAETKAVYMVQSNNKE